VLALYAFEGIRNEFARGVRKGDVVVAGRNFGCGSSREHAPLALIGSGVGIIIARSYARIFYRNAVNVGILPLVCQRADEIPDGADITVNLNQHIIEYRGKELLTEPVPGFLQDIINAGGLIVYARNLEEVQTCTGSQ
jgi:3-isopropylmalate/(R)-2-methylmalate dehydratase small subunit